MCKAKHSTSDEAETRKDDQGGWNERKAINGNVEVVRQETRWMGPGGKVALGRRLAHRMSF